MSTTKSKPSDPGPSAECQADRRARARSALWALGFFALTLILRLPFIRFPFAPWDESYYATVARAAVGGGRIYADMGYVRPPGLNLVYELAYRISGLCDQPFDLTVRVLAAIAAAAAVGVLAAYLFRRVGPLPAAAASLVAALLSASLTLQNEANSETWMMLPYTLSALMLFQAVEEAEESRSRTLRVVFAGVFMGLAATFKEVALVNLALPVAAAVVFRGVGGSRWLRDAARFLAGAAAVGVAALGALTAQGQVVEYLYYTWFTRLVYMGSVSAPKGDSRLLEQLNTVRNAFTLPFAAAVAGAALSIAQGDRSTPTRRLTWLAGAWLAVSGVGVAASGRYFEHYFIQMSIPLALLLAASTATLLERRAPNAVLRAIPAVVLAASIVFPAVSWAHDRTVVPETTRWRGMWSTVAERVDELTPAGGSHLVWGPILGVRAYAETRSATRLAWFYYEFSAPGGRNALGRHFPSYGDIALADLETSPPDTIVLTAELGEYLPGAGVSELVPRDDLRIEEKLYSMVRSDFREVERTDEYVILTRSSVAPR